MELEFTTASASSRKRKKHRPSDEVSKQDKKSGLDSGALWSEKYRPSNSKEIASHHSKKTAVKKWITKAKDTKRTGLRKGKFELNQFSMIKNISFSDQKLPVLVLCGCSGCCKSTMVEVIAKELCVPVIEWSDDYFESQNVYNKFYAFQDYANILEDRDEFNNKRSIKEQVIDDLDEFVVRSAYSSLNIVPSSLKTSRMEFTSTKKKKLQHVEHVSREYFNNKRWNLEEDNTTNHIILVHDPSSLFVDSYRFKESTSSEKNICSQLLKFRNPVVLIVSDVGGRDDVRWAVEELIPRDHQEFFDLTIEYCTPITENSVKKVLKKIADHERMELSNRRFRSPLTDEIFDEIAVTCLGDLRQAVMQLQFYCLGQSVGNPTVTVSKQSEMSERDKSFSFLHGIAKLLRTRIQAPSNALDNCCDFYIFKFAPDVLMSQIQLDIDVTMSFLQYNYLAIFEGQEQNAQQLEGDFHNSNFPQPSYDTLERAERLTEILSDADLLHTCQYSTRLPMDRSTSSSFPKEYVESICSRAPACSMYPSSHVSHIFASAQAQTEQEHKIPTADAQYQMHSGPSGLVKQASTSSNVSSNQWTPIRRPPLLDVRKKKRILSMLTKTLRTALVTCPAAFNYEISRQRQDMAQKKCFVPPVPLLKAFDFLARAKGSHLQSKKYDSLKREVEESDDTPPSISFLSSEELLTVMVPYLRVFLSATRSQTGPGTYIPNIDPCIENILSDIMDNLSTHTTHFKSRRQENKKLVSQSVSRANLKDIDSEVEEFSD